MLRKLPRDARMMAKSDTSRSWISWEWESLGWGRDTPACGQGGSWVGHALHRVPVHPGTPRPPLCLSFFICELEDRGTPLTWGTVRPGTQEALRTV